MSAIHLLPMGGANVDLIEEIRSPLGEMFRVPVETRELPVDLEQFYDENRAQYNSTNILLYLKEQYGGFDSGNGVKALAVVPFDLFIPILTYVFGEAEVGGNVAVVSYHRLNPERYGLAADAGLLRERFIKEALHELGHARGLIHCASQKCVMHSSSYVEDIDLKGRAFCTACAELIAVL
jgi:archaemetzincin